MAAANILLAANQPQGIGQALNASQSLGLGVPGQVLKNDLQDQIAERRKALDLKPLAFGAASVLFG